MQSIFQKNTTLLCIVLFVVLVQSILIKYMHRLSYKHSVSKQNGICFVVDTFATLLRSLIGKICMQLLSVDVQYTFIEYSFQTETSTPTLPDSKAIQFVYGVWFGSCLIISCLFTTTLTSFFTEPGHVAQIKTVSDIVRSKIPLSINELYIYIRKCIRWRANNYANIPLRYYPVLTSDAEQLKYFLSVNVNQSVPIGLKLAALGQVATFTDVLRARHISVQWVSWYGDSSIYYIRGDQTTRYG